MRDIVLPETKPASEWVNGRALQKVSPQQKHALAQGRFWAALDAWARQYSSGVAGTEWEFRLAPPGEVRRPLVPDVAFVSYARVPREQLKDIGIPRVAPDVVVEVLSPGDRKIDVDEKVRVYLSCGTSAIFLVDTESQAVSQIDGATKNIFSRGDVLRHVSLPGFALPVGELFDLP
jgi:Uma2 family endonuclease